MDATIDPTVATYLDAARSLLGDVPETQREELAESVEEAILEVAAESDGDLHDVLGPPEVFVAELRAASGVGPAAGPSRVSSIKIRLSTWRDRLRTRRVWKWSDQLARELRPAWWVVRAGVVLWLLAEGLNPWQSWEYPPFPIPNVTGEWFTSLVLLIAAIVGSVELGRRTHGGWKRFAVRALNALAVFALVASLAAVQDRLEYAGGSVRFTDYAEPVAVFPAIDEAWVFLANGVSLPFHSPDELAWAAGEFNEDGRVVVTYSDGTTVEYGDIGAYLAEN